MTPRRRRRRWISRARHLLGVALIAVGLLVLVTSPAGADGPVGSDPTQNYPAGPMPPDCDVDGTTPACVDAAVGYLDQARGSLGQAGYGLPSNFDSLTPPQQAFVLANLDRVLYGLAPIPGLTPALSQDALGGVQTDTDPAPSDPDVVSYTSNWAGGFQNFPLAYQAWMYDDGAGSGNLDCTPANASGCWGHRHDVLWQFDPGGALAMGVAAGKNSVGRPGYAMLIVQGDAAYHPAYSYTWAQAVAAGAHPAGAPPARTASAPARTKTTAPAARTAALTPRITRVRVSGHTVRVSISPAHGAQLRCALARHGRRGWGRESWRRCSSAPVFRRLARGRYRLRVRSAGRMASHVLTVR